MNKPVILVVEDDVPVRNLMRTTLKTHDYKYLTAPTGKEAVMLASSHNPDVVFLDLGLPDMDGVEVIRQIRSWSNMPIIVISARSEDEDKITALDKTVLRRRAACPSARYDPASFHHEHQKQHGQFRIYEWNPENRLCCRMRVPERRGDKADSDRVQAALPSRPEYRESPDAYLYHAAYLGPELGQ